MGKKNTHGLIILSVNTKVGTRMRQMLVTHGPQSKI